MIACLNPELSVAFSAAEKGEAARFTFLTLAEGGLLLVLAFDQAGSFAAGDTVCGKSCPGFEFMFSIHLTKRRLCLLVI